MTLKRIVTWMPTIPVTVRTFKICDIKNDDSYETGASKASKTRTVTRIASLIVGTFGLFDIKNYADSYEHRPGLGVRGPYQGQGGREGGEGGRWGGGLLNVSQKQGCCFQGP